MKQWTVIVYNYLVLLRLVSYMKRGTMILLNYLVLLPAGVIHEAGNDYLIELLGLASGWCHT